MSDKNNESQFHFLIIGALIVIVIILAGGKLHEIDFFGILKFRIPTETPSSSTNSLVPTESEIGFKLVKFNQVKLLFIPQRLYSYHQLLVFRLFPMVLRLQINH